MRKVINESKNPYPDDPGCAVYDIRFSEY